MKDLHKMRIEGMNTRDMLVHVALTFYDGELRIVHLCESGSNIYIEFPHMGVIY